MKSLIHAVAPINIAVRLIRKKTNLFQRIEVGVTFTGLNFSELVYIFSDKKFKFNIANIPAGSSNENNVKNRISPNFSK